MRAAGSGLFADCVFRNGVRVVDVKDVLGYFVDYRFGNVIVDYITMAAIVHLILGVALLVLLRKVFIQWGVN